MSSLGLAQGVSLQALSQERFADLARLASRIWHAHYSDIISHAQIDYMLRGRFESVALSRYLHSQQRWLELLCRDEVAIGYCSYSLSETPDALKLEQLYLAAEHQGRGLGTRMLEHVEARAHQLGRGKLVLTVNKRNQRSIAIYRKRGFEIDAEIEVDIGGGFVMDDYVMHKPLR